MIIVYDYREHHSQDQLAQGYPPHPGREVVEYQPSSFEEMRWVEAQLGGFNWVWAIRAQQPAQEKAILRWLRELAELIEEDYRWDQLLAAAAGYIDGRHERWKQAQRIKQRLEAAQARGEVVSVFDLMIQLDFRSDRNLIIKVARDWLYGDPDADAQSKINEAQEYIAAEIRGNNPFLE
jgi:hypothetical protein